MRLTFLLLGLTVALFLAQNLFPLTAVRIPVSSPVPAETDYALTVNGAVAAAGTVLVPAGESEFAAEVLLPEFMVQRVGISFADRSVSADRAGISAVSAVTQTFSLTPTAALAGSPWQFLTYLFMHANVIHILFNMFTLFIFGTAVEDAIGKRRFLALYVAAGLGSAALHIALTGVSGILLLGASGAVFGAIAVYGILFPRNWIFTLFGPMPAFVAVPAFAALEFVFGVTGLEAGVANFGHLGGILTGVAVGLALRYQARRRPVSLPSGYEFVWQ